MSGHGEKLSRKQEEAISALLSTPSIHAAAAQCSVAESTLRRWLLTEPFKVAYLGARRQLVEHAVVLMQKFASTAVSTLAQIMTDHAAPASSRVAAARTVLELSLRAVEIEDLAVRITALEQGRPA